MSYPFIPLSGNFPARSVRHEIDISAWCIFSLSPKMLTVFRNFIRIFWKVDLPHFYGEIWFSGENSVFQREKLNIYTVVSNVLFCVCPEIIFFFFIRSLRNRVFSGKSLWTGKFDFLENSDVVVGSVHQFWTQRIKIYIRNTHQMLSFFFGRRPL